MPKHMSGEFGILACDIYGQMFIPYSLVFANDKCYDGENFRFDDVDKFLKGVSVGRNIRVLPREIVAWMPLPEPYKGEQYG